MSKLFVETYDATDEGRATEAPAKVATVVEDRMGTTMDDDTRLSVLLELQRIERDDLPEDLQRIYDATCSWVGTG